MYQMVAVYRDIVTKEELQIKIGKYNTLEEALAIIRFILRVTEGITLFSVDFFNEEQKDYLISWGSLNHWFVLKKLEGD